MKHPRAVFPIAAVPSAGGRRLSKTTRAVPICGAVAALALGSITCRGEKTYRVEIADGVRIVHNLRPASERPKAGLAFVRKIGELEAKDSNVLFLEPMSVAEDDRGNIFVLDTKDFCVKKYGPDGAFIRRFGRKGQGPGEFDYPMSLSAGGGRLAVSSMSMDFDLFNEDGDSVGHCLLPPYRGLYPALLNSGRLVCYAFQTNGENNRDNNILAVFDFEGRIQKEFGEPFLLETAQKTWNANFFNSAVDDADNVYVSFSYQNRIEKYSGEGKFLLSIDRVLPYPVEFRFEKTTMDIGGKAVPIDQPAFTPVSRGIGVDGRGRIWVMTFQKPVPRDLPPDKFIPGDFLAFEVYDEGGTLLSRVPLPREFARFDNWTMHRDHLFFVDPFDQACVYQYAVIDGEN